MFTLNKCQNVIVWNVKVKKNIYLGQNHHETQTHTPWIFYSGEWNCENQKKIVLVVANQSIILFDGVWWSWWSSWQISNLMLNVTKEFFFARIPNKSHVEKFKKKLDHHWKQTFFYRKSLFVVVVFFTMFMLMMIIIFIDTHNTPKGCKILL